MTQEVYGVLLIIWLLVVFWVVSPLRNERFAVRHCFYYVRLFHVALSCYRLSFFAVPPTVLLSTLDGPLLACRTWTRPSACGSCVGTPPCVMTHPIPHYNSTPPSPRPPLLRSLPGCMCRAYASSKFPILSLPRTLHRGLVVRFAIDKT